MIIIWYKNTHCKTLTLTGQSFLNVFVCCPILMPEFYSYKLCCNMYRPVNFIPGRRLKKEKNICTHSNAGSPNSASSEQGISPSGKI